MDPFEIKINGETLLIIPMETGEYQITKNGKDVATIYPNIGIDLEVEWITNDLFPLEYAQKIGEEIERYEM
jgi:hypothetical protein